MCALRLLSMICSQHSIVVNTGWIEASLHPRYFRTCLPESKDADNSLYFYIVISNSIGPYTVIIFTRALENDNTGSITEEKRRLRKRQLSWDPKLPHAHLRLFWQWIIKADLQPKICDITLLMNSQHGW